MSLRNVKVVFPVGYINSKAEDTGSGPMPSRKRRIALQDAVWA